MWLRKLQASAVFTLGTLTGVSLASPPSIPTAWSACFQAAGRYYQLSPQLLMAIAQTESHFNPVAMHVNRNGTRDIGLMQINSRWFAVLHAAGIAPGRLYEPCVSIWVGAWLLADVVAHRGYTWDAVGAYNAGNGHSPAAIERRAAYAVRVARNLPVAALHSRLLDTGDGSPSRLAEHPIAAGSPDDPASGGKSGR